MHCLRYGVNDQYPDHTRFFVSGHIAYKWKCASFIYYKLKCELSARNQSAMLFEGGQVDQMWNYVWVTKFYYHRIPLINPDHIRHEAHVITDQFDGASLWP